MIGGPHSSFECLCEEAGGVSNMVANFVQGLERYRVGDWSAPRLPNAPMTIEEQQFAMRMNASSNELMLFNEYNQMEYMENKVMDSFQILVDKVKETEENCASGSQEAEPLEPFGVDPLVVTNEQVEDLMDITECKEQGSLFLTTCEEAVSKADNEENTVPDIQCSVCGDLINSEIWLPDCVALGTYDDNDADEKIQKIKSRWTLLESGIDVDYRCIKCRECIQCKKSDKAEKISLREEQEMQLVRESIFLDWENKRVVCTLPVRGEETDFLTSNKDIALKVLDQQCRKWSKDQVNKEKILAAFQKLFKTGDTRFMHQLSQEEKDQFAEKPVQYFIPWRVVYANSPTTPVRPVLDASSVTRRRRDGTGGRCLNDYVVKGKVESLNLVRLALGFSVGLAAVLGDLSQFYYSFKLKPQQWNLQRFLWRDNLDPDGEVLEGVIGALIYGVKCVSAQTETSMEDLADAIEDMYPDVAEFIRKRRYVDDLGKSAKLLEELKRLAIECDIVFDMIGLKCKAWTFSGEEPPSVVAMEGGTVKIAGERWRPKLDLVEVPVPDLHFAKKQRGKLPEETEIFRGTFAELDNFTPKNLTRKHVASKMGSFFDLKGKFAPLTAGLKADMRTTVKKTLGWNDPMPPELRSKWLENLWLLEQLRGVQFTRARMPLDAVSEKMRLITLVDAAMGMLMIAVWVGFLRSGGAWSCQHLIGRALLADEDSTIPRNELQSLCGGANLSWVVKKTLGDLVERSIVAGDSEIALCWTTAMNKPLAVFHRNRAVQIRRSVELEDLFHVRTDVNPSDVGTRPDKVTLADVGPGSRWENGDLWMTMDLECAKEQGFIKPASSLRIKDDQEEDFRKGLTFEKVPELLTRGHQVSEKRLGLMEQRAEYSQYLVLPTKFSFPKVVRIMSIVIGFVSKLRKGRKMVGRLLVEGHLWFSVFHVVIPGVGLAENADYQEPVVGTSVTEVSAVFLNQTVQLVGAVVTDQDSYSTENSLVTYYGSDLTSEQKDLFHSVQTVRQDMVGNSIELLCDKYTNQALLYLYRKATCEIKHFNKGSKLERISVEREEVFLSRGRILDDMNFRETSELPFLSLGNLGVRTNLPMLDRHSPLAYSVAEHVHWDLAKHKGAETCNRVSLENVFIIQGATLYKEMGEDCIRCKMKRKKHLEAAMGPISDSQLTLAPPCWMVQVDLFGPITVFVPGFERSTRNRQVLEAKCWVMTAVCPTTRLVNLQVLESTKAAGWIDGFTRLSCEVGIPTHVFVDQDSAGMSAFELAEVEFRDLQLRLHREKGISISVCGVAGHDRHGHVERVIRSVQESLEDAGLKQKILHATGLQTLCKLVESQYNNLPLGYHYSRAADNTSLLKILTPNQLRIGRVNKRSLDGPIKLPESRMDLLTKVEETYIAWYRIWLETLVPKLMFTPKWFRSDKELKAGDLVYFRKSESALDGKWVVGMVDSVERSRDNIIRMVTIKYFNGLSTTPQFTLRTVRQLVKLWDIDDIHLADDLAEMQRKFGPIPEVDPGQAAANLTYDIDMTDDQDVTIPGHYNDSMLQDAVHDNQRGGDDTQGGDDDQHQGDEGQPQHLAHLADLKDQHTWHSSKCRACCCKAHHNYSLHYRGNKFTALPCDNTEWELSSLSRDLEPEGQEVLGESLESLMMAVNVDINAFL